MNQNLYALLQSRFPNDPEAIWIQTGDGEQLRYSDIDEATARYAGALAAQGVVAGERVLVQVDKSAQTLILYLAALRLGAIFVPINTAYTPTEVSYFLNDAKPRLFIARPESEASLRDAAKSAGAELFTFDTEGGGSFAQQVSAAEPVREITAVAADDVASIIYTSGTTGRSKGAMLTHHNLASNALTLIDLWGFRSTDVLLHALPIYHVHGLFVAVHCAMLCGIPMRFLPKFDADDVMHQLPDVTVMMGVPTFYTRLLQTPGFDQDFCRHMRLFISDSAPLLEQTWESFYEKTGHKILERYGMSEAIMIASNPLEGDRLPGTVGFALPGVTIRVCDSTDQILPAGETGVLQMQGPNVFKGYWQMPEKTASEFTNDGFFISGDMAKMGADGRVIIVGREKDLVISGGLNIYPKEIEEAIDALAGVDETAVIGVPHADLGEGLVAVIRSDSGADIDPEAMIATLKSQLAGFKVPRKIFTVDELPRNAMGKVQKNVLRDQFAKVFEK